MRVVSLAVFFIMMPQSVTATLAASSPLVTDEVTTAEVTSAFITNYTGTNGMFTAIIIGLLAPTLFIAVSGVDKLRIKMPDGVPPAVEKSFNVLIPMLLTLGAFGLVAMILFAGFQTDITAPHQHLDPDAAPRPHHQPRGPRVSSTRSACSVHPWYSPVHDQRRAC